MRTWWRYARANSTALFVSLAALQFGIIVQLVVNQRGMPDMSKVEQLRRSSDFCLFMPRPPAARALASLAPRLARITSLTCSPRPR